MANSLKLYVSTQNNKLVQSDTDASDFTLPTFFQGDVLVSSENTPMAGGCSRSHLAVSSLPVTGYLRSSLGQLTDSFLTRKRKQMKQRKGCEAICCNFELVTKLPSPLKNFQVDQSIYQICSLHYTNYLGRSGLSTYQNVPTASKFENQIQPRWSNLTQ